MQLSAVRNLVRQRSDMEGSQFCTDPEITAYINASYGELYDLLVSRFEDYFLKVDGSGNPPQFTLTGGVGANMYALPSDFYKDLGIDFQNAAPNDWITVRKFMFQERNAATRSRNRLRYGLTSISYRIMGQYIYILPEDQSAGTYRFWYIPRVTLLVADSDDMSGVMDFEEYVVVDAAMKCLIKEESDVTPLMAIKEQLRQRILSMSSHRDAAEPDRVQDVEGTNYLETLYPR